MKKLLILLLFISVCKAQTEGTIKQKDGSTIYYRVFGKGEPLLIINGGPGMNSNGFELIAKKLAQTNQTIIYDQRGTGKSYLPKLDSTTITMNLMVEDMEALRKELKIEKWSVLGHSFGGILASYYAIIHPESMKSIIFSASGGIDLGLLNYVNESINSKLTSEELASVKYWTKKIADGDTTHATALERGKALAPAYLYNKKFVPILAERLTQGNQTINQLIWNDLRRINFDCSTKLKKFDKPVLIIQGKQDIIKAETAEKAHAALKNSKIVFMDSCGHYGWLDNEPVYMKEVNSFLAKVK